jgi:hypothetical protein
MDEGMKHGDGMRAKEGMIWRTKEQQNERWRIKRRDRRG